MVKALFKAVYETLFHRKVLDMAFVLNMRKILRLPNLVDNLKSLNVKDKDKKCLRQHKRDICRSLIASIFEGFQ